MIPNKLEYRPNGLFGWYPVKNGARILCFGKCSDTGYFASKGNQIDVICTLEDECSYYQNLYSDFSNVNIIKEYTSLHNTNSYDYIFYNYSDVNIILDNNEQYTSLLSSLRSVLTETGVILLCVPNRFGARYICGTPDIKTGVPFDGIYERDSCRMDCSELKQMACGCGFKNICFHYPYPDNTNPSCIYSDKLEAGEELFEKVKFSEEAIGSKLMNIDQFMRAAAKNFQADFFSDNIIAEISNSECGDVIYSSVTAGRDEENAFITNVHESGMVSKVPIYKEGLNRLATLKRALDELENRNIPVVNLKIENNIGIMPKVSYPTLSDHLRRIIKGKDDVIPYLEKIYDLIIRSSDKSDTLSEHFKALPYGIEYGPVLKNAFFEIIPVNIFYNKGELVLFDQECVINDAPAGFIIYRCIHDLIIHIPEFALNYDVESIKNYFNISGELWNCYMKIESEIIKKDYCSEQTSNKTVKSPYNSGVENQVIQKNREHLKMNINLYDKLFDPFFELGDRRIVLFGSGNYADSYLETYGMDYPPLFIIDNSPEKQGTSKNGIEIKSPEALKTLIYGTFRIVIAVGNSNPIVDQLEKMGYDHNSYRIYHKKVTKLLPYKMNDTMIDGKYNIGYIPGAFDLFHIGHLNILRRCKEHCHYLIAGVINDDIVRTEKHKEPVIPFEERLEIVKQCKFVDRAIEVDSRLSNKLDAWKELRFGCLFSGSDHDEGYADLQSHLRILGSDLMFFPYTQGTSSTKLAKFLESQSGK